ncbi:MAG: hypothetical protein II173_08750, partial [Firmicutes bacterium]|nr:hypothetical protein [Bacillota bacterium]
MSNRLRRFIALLLAAFVVLSGIEPGFYRALGELDFDLGTVFAAPVEKQIVVNTYDVTATSEENALVPNSSFGSGYELRIYEFPASVWDPREAVYGGSQFGFNMTMEDYNAFKSYQLFNTGGTPFMVTGQDYKLTLTMEEDATEENPYFVVFMAGGEPEEASTDFPFSTQRAPSQFSCFSIVMYDGTTAGNMFLQQQGEDDIPVLAFYDPSYTQLDDVAVSFDTTDFEGDAYPVYAQLSVYLLSTALPLPAPIPCYSVYEAKVSARIEEDGSASFHIPYGTGMADLPLFPYGRVPYIPVAVGIYSDEALTEPDSGWTLANAELYEDTFNVSPDGYSFFCSYDDGGHIVYLIRGDNNSYHTGGVFAPAFEKGRMADVSFDIVPYSSTPEEAYPVYVEVEMRLDDTFLGGKTVELSANGRVPVEFSVPVTTGGPISVELHPYKDAEKLVPATDWVPENLTSATLAPDGTLTKNGKVVEEILITHEKTSTPVLDIHINYPEGVDEPFMYRILRGDPEDPSRQLSDYYRNLLRGMDDAVHFRLYRMGGEAYEQVWTEDNQSYSGHYVAAGSFDSNWHATMILGDLPAGTYYLAWFMSSNESAGSAYSSAWDPAWVVQEDPVRITVDAEGQIFDENGDPFTAEILYKEDYKRLVDVKVDVETHYPDGYM